MKTKDQLLIPRIIELNDDMTKENFESQKQLIQNELQAEYEFYNVELLCWSRDPASDVAVGIFELIKK